MKDKIFIFIIGVLVGAVLSTGAFYIYTTTTGTSSSNTQETQMNGDQPPDKPDGNGEPPQGNPPEKPDGENGQPPEKPSDNNSQSNSTQKNN